MTLPKELSSLLDWKLLHGSHEFPGPDGGTCINEAAIIAAGFEYREVCFWQDCPPCFSPLIAQWAISLNDTMDDESRKVLIPYVTRLAGTRGTKKIERKRAEHLLLSLIRKELADLATQIARRALADSMRSCFSLTRAAQALKLCTQVSQFRGGMFWPLAQVFQHADNFAAHLDWAFEGGHIACLYADTFPKQADKNEWLKTRGVQLLDELIAIHPGTPIEIEEAAYRLNKARAKEVA